MIQNLSGARFGKLVVLRYEGKRKDGHYLWLCQCDCGNKKKITRNRLMCSREPTRSCGCAHREAVFRKHGMSHTAIYKIWSCMKQRCFCMSHPSYKDYGKRGITVCNRWLKFENFFADMGDPPERGIGKGKLSLERVDNDSGYCKANCKWAYSDEQSFNRRNTVRVTLNGVTKPLKIWCIELGVNYSAALNRFHAGKLPEIILRKTKPRIKPITFKGRTQRAKEWAEELGIQLGTLLHRLHHGWTIDEAFTTPLQNQGH